MIEMYDSIFMAPVLYHVGNIALGGVDLWLALIGTRKWWGIISHEKLVSWPDRLLEYRVFSSGIFGLFQQQE